MTDTITLRYDGPSPRVRVPAFDIDVHLGETIEVDPDVTVPLADPDADEDETQSLPVFLQDRHGFEPVRDYTDVLSGSVDDLEAALETGEYDAHLAGLAHAEREGQNRSTALDAIHDRQDAVQEDS